LFFVPSIRFGCNFATKKALKSNLVMFAGASLLGLGFVDHAVRLVRSEGDRHAMRTFGYSIVYLTSLLPFAIARAQHRYPSAFVAGYSRRSPVTASVPMLHLVKSAASRAITLGLIGLLVVGLMIGAVRLALPFADLFRANLEGALSETLGLPVRVGHLGLRLAGDVPQLRLRDVQLLDPESGFPQLSLEELQVDLSPFATLREMAPQIQAVTLVGAHLVIKRTRDGAIAVSGLEGVQGGDPEAMAFFFGAGTFLLADSDVQWIDEKAGASTLHLSDVRIRFENSGEHHRIGVLAGLFGDPQTHLRLVADMRGVPGSPVDWQGEIYFHWQGRNLNRVLEGRLPAGLHLGSESVEIESWSHLSGAVVTESLNRIAVEGLKVWSNMGKESGPALSMDRLGGLLRWRQSGNGWRLEVEDLALIRGGSRRPPADLGIHFVAGVDGDWTIEGGSEFLDLGDASDLLAQMPELLPDTVGPLAAIHVEGGLQDLRFRFRHQPVGPPQWAVTGRVDNLALEPLGNLPGVRGLTIELAASERGGSSALSSSDLRLTLPRLLPSPIRLDEAGGLVRWQRGADGALQIGSRELTLGNADMETRSRFSIVLPPNGGSPFLDLQTEIRDLDVASVRRYVPSKRLKKKLASWLDRAFISGRVPSGALLFHGAIADFPFDASQGRFRAVLDLQDCVLDFHPEWPRLEGIEGEVRFENRKLEISASKGRFLNSELVSVSARIPDLGHAVAVEILGTTEGPFADGLRVLAETPLHKKLGALAGAFAAEGVARLDLDMAVPLPRRGRKEALRLAGELSWPGPATLSISDLDIDLRDLAGKLRFTARTLEAESIQAKLWDVPIEIRVDTPEAPGQAGVSNRIRATGRFPIAVLARRFPSRLWGLVKGRAGLKLRLDVGAADMGKSVPQIDFEVTSNLAGLSVELPEPLGKTAAESRRLRLSGRLGRGQGLRIEGAYGDLGLDMGLEKGGDGKLRLVRGTFNAGGDSVPLPKGEGLYLSGAIPALDLDAWLDWWARESSTGGNLAGGNPGLRSVALRVDRLLWSGAAFNEVRVDLDKKGNGWEAELGARELAGKASIPHRPRAEPIRIQLQRLDLKGVLGREGEEVPLFAGKRIADPRRAHTLNLSIEQLLWGENPLGRLTFRSQAVPEGLDFTEMALAGPLMSIQGRGSWKQSGEKSATDFSLTAEGADLGQFLRSLELRSLFYKAPVEATLQLSWSGGPGQIALADLKGRVDFDLGAGSLLEVEPGVGRVLGILNLEALQRRLTLDFSDLFGRGFAFEKISGALRAENGKATIEKFLIEGPSADLSIAGTANLVDKELNQIVTVTPRIGTGVAIASAVAGGPLVGAAVFLADKVSGGGVDKLGRHQYVVTGPWTEPQIRRGRLSVDEARDVAEGHRLPESGRAGAAEPQGLEDGQRRIESPPQTRAETSEHAPRAARDDGNENLFLEGY